MIARNICRAALISLSLFSTVLICRPASAYTATVGVDAGQNVATVPGGLGIDTAVYDNNMIDAAVPNLLAGAGVNLVRYPGGSYADIFHWQTTTGNGGYIVPADNFDNFMNDVVKPAGATAMITVNYGANAAGTDGGDPNEAAAWVAYAKTKNYGIKYWEIGNEQQGNGYAPYGGSWEEDLYADKSPGFYGRTALTFIKDMKAQDPTIKCGVGIVAPGTWPDNSSVPYNQNVLQACGGSIDFVIIHWYPGGTGTDLLNTTDTIAGLVSAVRAQLTQYCGANASHIEICVTETGPGNFQSGQGAPFSLFATDDFLTWFENGATAVTWQELHGGYLDYSDTPQGPWYGEKMASLFGSPGDTIVRATSSTSTLVSHAAHKSSGAVSVILLNRDPNNAATVSVAVSNTSLGSTGTRYDFGQANFGNSSFIPTSGIAQSSITGVGGSFTVTVPAMTESIIVIPALVGGPVANGTYHLQNRADSSFLDTLGYKTPGTAVGQYPSTGSINQQWTLTYTGGYYTLTNPRYHNLLDSLGYKTPGAAVGQWPKTSSANQQWSLVATDPGYYKLVSRASGLCLDTGGLTASGSALRQTPSSASYDQQWSIK